MKMKRLNLLVVFAILGYMVVYSQEINTLTPQEKKDGWKLLFNGKNLKGWEMFNGGKITGWHVEDGILYNSGKGSDHGGDIMTKKQFKDFELYLEWRIDPKSNSGVFYRVEKGVTDRIYESGPEYQLLDDKGWPTKLHDSQYTGSFYAVYPAQGAEVKPIDEWNVTRIVVKGNHVEHYLNGKKVVECDMWSDDWVKRKNESKWKNAEHYAKASKGHIGLQDHGGLTRFRNIKIRKL